MTTRSDDMFTLRRPRSGEIPELRALLTTFFESGEFGRELSFGELEIEDYLDWFLPRALVDQSRLLCVLEYHAKSSARSYKSKLIGCCYVDLSQSNVTISLQENYATWKLRFYNRIGDIQIWPNRQAAEVHRRFQRVLEEKMPYEADTDLASRRAHFLFAAIQPKYRGIGLGSKVMSWTIDLIRELGVETVAFVGNDQEAQFMCQSGFSHLRGQGQNVVCTLTI